MFDGLFFTEVFKPMAVLWKKRIPFLLGESHPQSEWDGLRPMRNGPNDNQPFQYHAVTCQ